MIHIILTDHFLFLMLVCVCCILAIPWTVVKSLAFSHSEVFSSQAQTLWDQDE